MWDYIKNDSKFKNLVCLIQVDYKIKNKSLVSEYNVKEYPSYVLQAQGKKYIYDELNDNLI